MGPHYHVPYVHVCAGACLLYLYETWPWEHVPQVHVPLVLEARIHVIWVHVVYMLLGCVLAAPAGLAAHAMACLQHLQASHAGPEYCFVSEHQ